MKSLKILNLNSHILLLGIWFMNDLFFKKYFPGIVTGKISDLIGIYLSPFILTAFIGTIFSKINENITFIANSLLVFCVFLVINISQRWNDTIYSLLEFGFKNKGTADVSDLVCLLALLPSYLNFTNYRDRLGFASDKRIILILSFIVFINTPAEPTESSNLINVIFLLSSPADAIYIEAPNNQFNITNNEEFKFRFVGKKNESSPPSIASLTVPTECTTINEIPTETNIPMTQYNNSNIVPAMLFKNYLILISKDIKFKSIALQNTCDSFNCHIDLSKLENDTYYWKVLTQFTYIRECILYLYKDEPQQTPGIFNKI